MYLTSEKPGMRRKAEEIVLAGIAREKKMLRPGKGFSMYPDSRQVSKHYSRLATRYLASLSELDAVPDLSESLRRAAREGIEMAQTVAKAHRMKLVPDRVESVEDAYAVASGGGDRKAAETFLSEALDRSGADVSLKKRRGRVSDRAELAYAAASLIALGKPREGVPIANQVTRQFNERGGLYSTVDSVAAIRLMVELRRSGLVGTDARVRANGMEMCVGEASKLADQVETVEVLNGVVAVEILRLREEDWSTYQGDFALRVGFRNEKGKITDRFQMGDRAELVVALTEGYRAGDLVHVDLPPAMAWIEGGGKVKRFSLDFEGKDEVRIPVIVSTRVEAQQHFAVYIRNMFEEERAASPGLLQIKAPRFG